MKNYTFEVRPCQDLGTDITECTPSEATFWGVYRRPTTPVDSSGFRPGDHVADFPTEAAAQAFATEQGNKP